MKKKAKTPPPMSVAADPEQWFDQSKQTVSYLMGFMREYVDTPYACWRCGAACIFSAEDQKYTFEVKKATIDQRRKFCAACWSDSHRLRAALVEHEARWAAEKASLRVDRDFLAEWLSLLTRWNEFEPYRNDAAKIKMLRRLLAPE